ncbi:MAG: HEAT repeat domain-containing protein [bacterium]
MSKQIDLCSTRNLSFAAKKQIIQSLGKQGNGDACRLLVEFLSDSDTTIQELAASTLIRINTSEVTVSLLPLLHKSDAQIQNMVMEIIAEIAYDHISLLIPLLQDSHEPIRARIADLLGLIGNPEAGEALIASLRDPSPRVRSGALASLGKLKSEDGIGAIERLLQTEEESWVIFSGIKSLEQIGGKKAIQILLELLKQDDEFILAACVESLGEIGSTQIISSMLRNIAHPSDSIIERMSTAFISILHRHGFFSPSKPAAHLSKQARADLISFFSLCVRIAINQGTRLRAIELLGKLKARESLDILSRIAQNGPSIFQAAAIQSLQHIGGNTARVLLLQLSPPWVQMAAGQQFSSHSEN